MFDDISASLVRAHANVQPLPDRSFANVKTMDDLKAVLFALAVVPRSLDFMEMNREIAASNALVTHGDHTRVLHSLQMFAPAVAAYAERANRTTQPEFIQAAIAALKA